MALFSDRPVGTMPDISPYVGVGVPDAAKVYAYWLPTVAVVGGLLAVNVGVAGAFAIVTVSCPVASEPALLAAWMLKEKLPSTVGVPDNTPLPASVNPGGRLPEATVKAGAGVPVALKV